MLNKKLLLKSLNKFYLNLGLSNNIDLICETMNYNKDEYNFLTNCVLVSNNQTELYQIDTLDKKYSLDDKFFTNKEDKTYISIGFSDKDTSDDFEVISYSFDNSDFENLRGTKLSSSIEGITLIYTVDIKDNRWFQVLSLKNEQVNPSIIP